MLEIFLYTVNLDLYGKENSIENIIVLFQVLISQNAHTNIHKEYGYITKKQVFIYLKGYAVLLFGFK